MVENGSNNKPAPLAGEVTLTASGAIPNHDVADI